MVNGAHRESSIFGVPPHDPTRAQSQGRSGGIASAPGLSQATNPGDPGGAPLRPVVQLAGGVGGAKLADGLQALLGPDLTVIVNTADDLDLHGLRVMPDHDTVMYTLAGLADPVQGWGLAGDTYRALEMLARYGAETWFRLGDGDLATHIARTARLRAGETLTATCRSLQRSLGVGATILPMAEEPVATELRTDEGWLPFQDYFVRRRQQPAVREVRIRGIEAARPTVEVLTALASCQAVVIGPSNPIVSIGPIRAVPTMEEELLAARRRGAPIVAVSPIVAGRALRGPADRMLASLGHEVSALGVARLYRDLIDGFLVDEADASLVPAIAAELGIAVRAAPTVMATAEDRRRLAAETLALAAALRAAGKPGD